LRLYRVEVLERRRIGEHLLLRYEWPGPEPEPGQFVGVRAAGLPEPFLSRPFFVHDRDAEGVSLLFKVRGRGTRALDASGQEILVSAPRGRGFGLWESGPAALVGGGVWVAPLKLLGRRLRESGVPHDVFLEAPPDIPDEYRLWLEEAYPGAEIISTDGPPGAVIGALGDLGGYRAVYVSGDRATLLSASARWAGAQLAVRERMACMDGSCYGCTVPTLCGGKISYSRVCVEGPVFRADELVC